MAVGTIFAVAYTIAFTTGILTVVVGMFYIKET